MGSMLPITQAESTSKRTYEGEVWGDLTAEGFIWGDYKGEHEYIDYRVWSYQEGDGLWVNVTNVSQVWLFYSPHGERINVTVVPENKSFEIFMTRGSIYGYWWDLDVHCVYTDFNGTFEGTDDAYYPIETIPWIRGTASIRHDPSESYDIRARDCIVVIDGIQYENASALSIPENETAHVSIQGKGGLRVRYGLFPIINGTLEINNFRKTEGHYTYQYKTIRFTGNNIEVRTTQHSDWWDHWGEGYDPWVIEVSVPPDCIVEGSVEKIDNRPPLYWALIFIICFLIILCVIMALREFRELRPKFLRK
jgi:hypothetical protein